MKRFNFILLLYLFFVKTDVEAEDCDEDDDGTSCRSEDNTVDCSVYNFTNIDGEIIDTTSFCSEKQCLIKCCPIGYVIYDDEECISLSKLNFTVELNFTMTTVHGWVDSNTKLISTSEKLLDTFVTIYNHKFMNGCGSTSVTEDISLLGKDGHLYIALDNSAVKYLNYNPLQFCADVGVSSYPDEEPVITFMLPIIEQSYPIVGNLVTGIAFQISSVFLILVLVVHMSLSSLRNMAGMMLMAIVSSMLVAYIVQSVMYLGLYIESPFFSVTFCRYTVPIIYFFMLSTYFWTNIMSFDLWWTFRGMLKQRKVHRHGISVKFIWYSLYAYGIPLVMTVAATLINELDVGPEIIKPAFDTCLYKKDETFLYLFVPAAIITAANWVFFLMTTYNIWKAKSAIANHSSGSRSTDNNNNRFIVYLRLSVVMGLSWILEFLRYTKLINGMVLLVIEQYNPLLGVPIFIVFVCKRKIIYDLCRRFNINNKFVVKLQASLYSQRTNTTMRTRSSAKHQEIQDRDFDTGHTIEAGSGDIEK